MHQHPDSIVVPLAAAKVRFHLPDGKSEEMNLPSESAMALDGKPAKTTWARGDVQFIGRGVPHEAGNTGDKPADFVIVSIR